MLKHMAILNTQDEERIGSPNLFYKSIRAYVPSLAAIIILLVLGEALSKGFISSGNIGSIMTQASLLSLVAIGQSLVIFSGEFGIDLSVGAIMSMGALTGSMFSQGDDSRIFITLIFLILLGGLIGFVNGVCVQKIGIPALAMTLVMATVVDGFTFLYTKGQPAVTIPSAIFNVGKPFIGQIRILVIIAIIVIVAMEIFLRKGRYGKYLYLAGNNRKASRLVGIRVNQTVIIAFVLSGVFSAIAGLFLVGYVGSGQMQMGADYTMQSIAAVVIGGARVAGGKGTLIGAFLGCIVMVLLTSVLTSVGMPEGTRGFLQGAILVGILMIQCRSPKLRQ
jgi:ribose transport system permease protein